MTSENSRIMTYRLNLFCHFCMIIHHRYGQDVQKVNAVENLKLLLLECKTDTITRFVPCVKDALQNGNEELHIISSRVFCDVAESQVLSDTLFAKNLLPIILENIKNDSTGEQKLLILCRVKIPVTWLCWGGY